jgi:hypothetical protein
MTNKYQRMKSQVKLLIILFTFILNYSVIAKDLKSAEYRTKLSYTYGRFEVRMKSADREGMLSSFFTYFDGTQNDPWESSKWNEIDLEIMGRYDDNVQFNVITPGQVNHESHFPTNFSPHLDYHTYAFEWTPQYIAWFVDGIEVIKQTGDHIATINRPQKIMMNVWNPLYENWAGTLNPVSLPAFAYYDWVSYYAYTPGTGNYGTQNNFSIDWTDNFDSWDTSRWEKATHTFGGNGCDFIEENAVFNDGKLILCLTNSTNTGYTDITPPSLIWARASTDKVQVMFSEEVDQSTAENVSNYVIPGTTINSATLKTNLKSVELSVPGLVTTSGKSLAVLAMKDRALVPNNMTIKATPIILPHPLSFPIKINCAGSAALDFLPDLDWNQNNEYGYLDGSNTNYPASLEISDTDGDVIFQSEKYNLVAYKIRVPNGDYNIKLMFAENYFDVPGSRIFDIYVQHIRVIENLDIISKVGKNTALEEEIENVKVTNEVLTIQFADKVNSALINGIVITPSTTGLNENQQNELNNFKVDQNYPNPFNSKTIINYSMHKTDNLIFQLFNILGEQIFFQDLGSVGEGSHQYFLDTATLVGNSPLTSGVYFYVFSTPNHRETRKLVLLN